jgi:lysozyme
MSTVLPDDVSLDGLNATRMEEGRALRAYQDSVGVYTIGYGLTNYDKGLPWHIGPGVTCTEAQAEYLLLRSLRENYLPAVKNALQGGTYAHPQGAVDGGLDMHFNTGGISKASWPRLLGAGNLAAAKVALESWNKAGGRVLGGLVRRRARNWLEVSEGQYGTLEGPVVIFTKTNNQEGDRGTGDLLTALPTDPGLVQPPKVVPGEPSTIQIPTTPNPGALRLGDAGPAVSEAQVALNAAGAHLPVTGKFDAATVAATKDFQRSHPHLTIDGEIGPATNAALIRAANMRAAAAKVTKTVTPGLPSLYIAFHQWVSAHAGVVALCAGGAVAVAVVAFLAYRYRNDLVAFVNAKLGRTVA